MAIRSAIDISLNGPSKPHVVTSSVEHDATVKILEHLEDEKKIGEGPIKWI